MVHFEQAPPEARQLLPVRIRDLGLSLERSPVAILVRRLYTELEEKGLRHFRPLCYLSDEWGSPSGQPVIGIPFYLGDPRVSRLEEAVNDVEGEREIMMYLRHEAGHAFNHAYELWSTDEWKALFGSTKKPYKDDFAFTPFSRDFVRYIPGWYAQKHPDEDLAETFAVWLDPESNWQTRYGRWRAIKKLKYVDRIASTLGSIPPPRRDGETDITVDEMHQTVEEFYQQWQIDEKPLLEGLALDVDLMDIFPGSNGETRPAADVVAANRRALVDKIHYWTGVRRTLVRELVLRIEQRIGEIGLVTRVKRGDEELVELTAYITTLAMTFLIGQKPLRHRRKKH